MENQVDLKEFEKCLRELLEEALDKLLKTADENKLVLK